MSNTDTRGSILVGVCQQDPDQWREFDSIYRPMLFAFLRKQGLNDSEAHDVVQDIFVKLLGKIHTYNRAKCKFRTWLFSLAQHTLIDKARRQATYHKALEGWVRNVLQASPSDSVKMAEAWAELHRTKILKHAMETVRARTSTRAWACFEQRLLRDRPGAEIARELGMTPNVVYVNACRVLKRVSTIGQEFDEDPRDALDSSHLSRRN
jgi:RNA polymerase sigma-70 factor (ECF subfamily)